MALHAFDRNARSARSSGVVFPFQKKRGFSASGSGTTEKILLLGFAVLAFCLLAIAGVALLRPRDAERTVVVQAPAAVNPAPQSVEMIDALVPIRTLEPGEELSPSLFAVTKRAKVTLPANTAIDLSQVSGRFAKTYIPPFFPFTLDMLSDKRPLNEVIGAIPEGFRAVTINVNATSSVEGWARAGANVDVQWVTEIRGERSAKRLVENAKILSAERKVESNQNPNEPIPTTVTLLVAEREAQKISLAASSGHLVLLLRGTRDQGKGSSEVGTLTLSDLIGERVQSEEKIQGSISVRGPNGSVEEMVIIDGKLQKRQHSAPQAPQLTVQWAQ